MADETTPTPEAVPTTEAVPARSKEEIMKDLESAKSTKVMSIDEAIMAVGVYEYPGEFLEVVADILIKMNNNDEATAKKLAPFLLGHCFFLMNKTGYIETLKLKEELLAAVQDEFDKAQAFIATDQTVISPVLTDDSFPRPVEFIQPTGSKKKK